MKKVSVFLPLQDEERKRFESAVSGAEEEYAISFHGSAPEASLEEIADANIIIGRFPADRLQEAKSLLWLQVQSAGVDAYVAPGVLPDGVRLTNARGAYGLAVSEHMLASTFALVRRFPEYMRGQARHEWKAVGNITSVAESTVLVLGLGDIGGRYARMMKALGAYVIGVRRSDSSRPDFVDEQYTFEQLPGIIGRADIVAMVLPGSKATEYLMDEEMLHRMKKGSLLINNGRGNAVDLQALCKALNEGHLAGAALDVTQPEPLPADDPLWDCENVLITPHVAGNFWLPRTFRNVVDIAVENLRRFSHGEELHNCVNRQKGY